MKPNDLPKIHVNLAAITREVHLETEGDPSAGATRLLERLKNEEPIFYTQKADEAMFFWARQEMYNAATRVRQELSTTGKLTTSAPQAPRGIQAPAYQVLNTESLRAVVDAWYQWPVLPGVPLGKATRHDLAQAADRYTKIGKRYETCGRWLSDLAGRVGSKPVRDVLSSSDIKKHAAAFGVTLDTLRSK